MNSSTIGIAIAAVFVIFIAWMAIKIMAEYERAVVFRLGRIQKPKGPGVVLVAPFADRVQRIDLRTHTYDVAPQDLITRDNVTVQVNAVTYYNVVDPVRAVVAIEDYRVGTQQVAQTTLRSIIGQVSLDDLLTKRDDINQRLQQVIDDVTNPWGVKVTIVEVKDVLLPESMRRAMARQAESERDRRAKVIHALGEQEAAENLAKAAEVMEAHPAALHLRTLSSMLELGAEKNSTVLFPLPMELLRLFEAVGQQVQPGGAGTSPAAPPASPPAAPPASPPESPPAAPPASPPESPPASPSESPEPPPVS